ncbi:MAG: hypothetical protein U0Z26_16960 [Anaerolineales bacterium]
MGYTNEAKSFLTQALNLRKAIGDKAGLAITQHNINTLNGVIMAPQNSGCRKYLGCGCGSAVGLAVLATITWIIFRFLFPPYTPVPVTLEPVIVDTDTPTQTATKIITNTPTKTFHPLLRLFCYMILLNTRMILNCQLVCLLATATMNYSFTQSHNHQALKFILKVQMSMDMSAGNRKQT